MEKLTEAIISLFELAEAEGRLARQKIVQTFVILLVYIGTALLIFTALGFLLAAIYYTLILSLPTQWVFTILGIICLLLSGITIWFVNRISRKL